MLLEKTFCCKLWFDIYDSIGTPTLNHDTMGTPTNSHYETDPNLLHLDQDIIERVSD